MNEAACEKRKCSQNIAEVASDAQSHQASKHALNNIMRPDIMGKTRTTSNVQRSASAEDGEPRTTAHRTHEGTVM